MEKNNHMAKRKGKIPDYIKNTVPYQDKDLDAEEKEIVRLIASGKLKPLPKKEFLREKAMLEAAAENYFKRKETKDSRITIRLSSLDLAAIKGIAYEEGLPYQTMISSVLHKFVVSHGH